LWKDIKESYNNKKEKGKKLKKNKGGKEMKKDDVNNTE
jgi:hypothetical protein|tara:strand:- start:329 stop:442 length:114 start_codon:yes stop_codon:yes gene_type:complete